MVLVAADSPIMLDLLVAAAKALHAFKVYYIPEGDVTGAFVPAASVTRHCSNRLLPATCSLATVPTRRGTPHHRRSWASPAVTSTPRC